MKGMKDKMKRMSMAKKAILFLCVMLIITGIYGGGYFVFNHVTSAKAKDSTSTIYSAKVNDKGPNKNSTSSKTDDNKSAGTEIKMDSNGYDAQEVSEICNRNYVSDGKKIAFLTFDDGPSTSVTPQILSTLDKYGIKATFFLIGKNIEQDQESKNVVKELYKDGQAIGNHTYSHEYRIRVPGSLYYNNMVNVDLYMQEIDKTNELISEAIGQTYKTRITRMPGGHMSREYYHDPNLALFDERLKEKNMFSIDWNAYDGDSDGKWKNCDQIFEEAKNTIGSQEKVVLLMHDTYGKEETSKALPRIIEYLKAQGYEFKKII